MKNKIKTLVIEDNEDNWIAIKSNLKKVADCIRAVSVKEGISFFEQNEVDLVILDLQLPGEPGLNFVEIIKADPLKLDVPIFVCTASIQPELKTEALSLGCKGFISKPFTRKEILYLLRDYLPHE